MTDYDLLKKTVKVIDSCKTVEQLRCACKYVQLAKALNAREDNLLHPPFVWNIKLCEKRKDLFAVESQP